MGDIIYNVTGIFQVVVFIITCYYLFLGFFGVYRKKELKNYTSKNKFAMIVAAHNEEVVIARLLESMQNQNYPKELYDIFVIADNCTDKTAEIAKKYEGITVCERFNDKEVGKGYALEWMFSKLFEMDKKYDAVSVFDADNIVHKDFLQEINSKMQEGYEVVQGYIDSKNPDDSWIAASYSIAFWSQNRLFQLSRMNLGLSNQIGGTGFAIATKTLVELGWGASCLTEDLEFTCKLILNNKKVGWAHDAKIYDEKPLKLKQSWVQRRRWMQGFSDVASRYCLKLFKKGIKERKWYIIDAGIYVLQPFVTLLLAVSAILGIIQTRMPHGVNIFMITDLLGNVGFNIFVVIQFILTPLVLKMDKKVSNGFFLIMILFSTNIFLGPMMMQNVEDWRYGILINLGYYLVCILITLFGLGKKSLVFFIRYLLYSIYTVTWIPITVQGILRKNNKEWNHTEHVRNVEMTDN